MSNVVRFGPYEADLSAGQLRKGGLKINLRDQSFQVLACLIEHPGKVVTREQLQRRLWHDDVFVDFENNLNTAIARLREVLCDSADHPRFIETLPRRGYRFVADVDAVSATAAEQQPSRARLMVLPFMNLSGDQAQEYFSDAMTEELISALAAIAPGRLAVIARTTAMHYKGSPKDVAHIGRELEVEYVVEGGVRRTEDQVAMTVQLIQTCDQTHLFARKSEDLVAYNLCIQGRYILERDFLTPEHFANAKRCFEAAIARNPNFALAYHCLADLYYGLSFMGFLSPKEALAMGAFHALHALEIDNTLAETHALLAMCRVDYDWAESRRELDRALALNPALPLIRLRNAIGLMPHGRLDEAVGEIECGLEIDPMSMFLRVLVGGDAMVGAAIARS